MSSGHYSTRADVSAVRRSGGGGMVIRHLFINCHHHGSSTGATTRTTPTGRLYLLCPACTAKKESKTC
jgi:hypothetical protein